MARLFAVVGLSRLLVVPTHLIGCVLWQLLATICQVGALLGLGLSTHDLLRGFRMLLHQLGEASDPVFCPPDRKSSKKIYLPLQRSRIGSK